MDQKLRILLLEDVPADAELVRRELDRAEIDAEVRWVETEQGFLEALDVFRPGLVLGDYSLPGYDGLSALAAARERRPDLPFIFVSGTIGEEAATETLKLGATDYVHKEHLAKLGPAIKRALQEAENRRERERAEAEMRKLSTAVEQGSDWVLITDPEGRIEYANRAVEKLSGFQAAELLGRTPAVFKSGQHEEAFFRDLWKTIRAGRSFRDIFVNRKKTGELFYLDQTITPLTDENGWIVQFVSTGKDITQEKAMEERLHFLAYYDALTGLPNRTLFADRLEQSIAQARSRQRMVMVVLLDQDRFKLINETFGTAAGDAVLKEVGKRLNGMVREGDTVARLGSDEFGLVLASLADPRESIRQVEKVMAGLKRPLAVEGEEIHATFSAGIALFPENGEDPESLIGNADAAFRKAKEQQGTSFQFFTDGLNIRASEFLLLERDLFHALRHGEFLLHYQPIYELTDRSLAGMEALIRWRHPDRGLVPPGSFITILEETGLILEVGDWILGEVIDQLDRWRQEGRALVPVSVNLSAIQFRQENLAVTFRRLLQEREIPGELLAVEVTESVLIHNLAHVSARLQELDDLGLRMVIDDFGTGYSSLAYLARLPVSKLKIDLSFVREMLHDGKAASIVAAIISMARDIGLQTIAEGVETEEQLARLQELGADMAQGFLLGRPMAADEMGKLLEKTRRR